MIPYSAASERLAHALDAESLVDDAAPYAVAMYETSLAFDVYRRWGSRPPLFQLTEADRQHATAALRRMGVPEGAWYVCVHGRGGGYSPEDENVHSYRNFPITDYSLAMKKVADRGGWCIRMGDPTMEPMPAQPQCFDYALSSERSDLLDIALAANCRLFLGCSSGLYLVATIFGRPCALANTAPLSAAYAQGFGDLAIPQRYMSEDGRMLSFAEVFASDAANFRKSHEYQDAGLVAVKVSPEEIAEIAMEALDMAEGSAAYEDGDVELQSLFRSYLQPGHYAHGTGSRIGRDFLRRHLHRPDEASCD